MKLVLSASLVDAVVKSASAVVVHAMSKAPLIEKAIGKKKQPSEAKTDESKDSKGFDFTKIPFFCNLQEKFEGKGIRVTRDETDLTIEINDEMLKDGLKPLENYANNIIDLFPDAIKAVKTFDNEVKAVDAKWEHVTGFEYTEPTPAEKADISYKYLDTDGNDVVIEPSKIKELLEKLQGSNVEAVSQHTNIPKNVLIALQREYKEAFK